MAGLIRVAGSGGAGGAVLLPFLPEQVEQDEEADGEERRADRTGEEYGEILIGDAERLRKLVSMIPERIMARSRGASGKRAWS